MAVGCSALLNTSFESKSYFQRSDYTLLLHGLPDYSHFLMTILNSQLDGFLIRWFVFFVLVACRPVGPF